MRTVWFCEQNKFCTRVLNHRWPGVPVFDDVHNIDGGMPGVDVLCGGFPCQPVSTAGKGLVQADERWLWPEFARIIRELRPRWVVLENVAALLGRGLGDVLGDLSASGYDAEWDCLPASAFGAPHRRDRIWIVAYPGGEGLEVFRGMADPQGVEEREPTNETDTFPVGREAWDESVNSSESLADSEGDGCRPRGTGGSPPKSTGKREPVRSLQDPDGGSLQPWRIGGRIAQASGSEWWAVEPPMGRVAHGVPDRLDQLAALGNALVPQIAEWIGSRIMSWEANQ